MTSHDSPEYAICISNDGYEAALITRKVYTLLSDEKGETLGLVRVIDESGEDYLYPSSMFERVVFTAETVEALERAG